MFDLAEDKMTADDEKEVKEEQEQEQEQYGRQKHQEYAEEMQPDTQQ